MKKNQQNKIYRKLLKAILAKRGMDMSPAAIDDMADEAEDIGVHPKDFIEAIGILQKEIVNEAFAKK